MQHTTYFQVYLLGVVPQQLPPATHDSLTCALPPSGHSTPLLACSNACGTPSQIHGTICMFPLVATRRGVYMHAHRSSSLPIFALARTRTRAASHRAALSQSWGVGVLGLQFRWGNSTIPKNHPTPATDRPALVAAHVRGPCRSRPPNLAVARHRRWNAAAT